MADVDPLDLLAQELGFALKSEQREALQSLLRENDVFCVLPTAKMYNSYLKILLSVKIRHPANNTLKSWATGNNHIHGQIISHVCM